MSKATDKYILGRIRELEAENKELKEDIFVNEKLYGIALEKVHKLEADIDKLHNLFEPRVSTHYNGKPFKYFKVDSIYKEDKLFDELCEALGMDEAAWQVLEDQLLCQKAD